MQMKVADNMKLLQSYIESDSGVEVHDSQIINMNRILCKSSPPGNVEQQLTPHQIWDFIEHIGVQEKTSIEDVIRRIGDMEQRDWDMFQEIASKEKHKAKGKA
ncbi:hypothetical protein Ancab_023106, partial [Ancistrocladus abbreviatus]